MSGRIYTGADVPDDLTPSCDVCVVGSGAGGAVLAHALVERGLSVVLLEEGGHHTRAAFQGREDLAYPALYQELANRATDDLSINILQGRSVGGGTTVNWCTSFRAPPRILEHWQRAYGVQGLSEAALAPHFDWIEQRLGIHEWPLERINRNNRILWEGCGALGYERKLLRRNVRDCGDLGYCGMGCPTDAKQSMHVTLIPEAVRAGLTVFANASARRLETRGSRVSAVHAELLDPATDRPTGKRLTVRAKVTAVACGAINSPALLLRSELTGGGRVGLRTMLHPVVVSAAEFEEPVQAFYGAPQSVFSPHFLDRGPDRLGFFIETPPVHPVLASMVLPGHGGDHQALMQKLPFTQVLIALTVDGLVAGDEGGSVGLRGGGARRLTIDYPLKPMNWEAFLAAQKAMARIQFAAGARSVTSLHANPVVMRSPADVDLLDRAPWEKLRVRVVTAHQMGGCAMGSDPRTSVVDSRLRYHSLDNLFVVDGSVFPTALGINPQETIFGLARWGADHVAQAVS